MNSYPDSTYKILAYASPYIQFGFDEAVDWACKMLEYGYDTPHLLMLAAITKPTGSFECEYYLEHALKELRLKKVNNVVATIFAVWPEVNRIANGERVRHNLTKIYQQHSIDQPNNYLSDFAHLYWAWDNLDDYGVQWYWHDDNLTRDTIEQFIVNYAKNWVEKYRPEIEKLILPNKDY